MSSKGAACNFKVPMETYNAARRFMCQGGDFTAGNGSYRAVQGQTGILMRIKVLEANQFTERNLRMRLSRSNTRNLSCCLWCVSSVALH